MYQRGIVKNGTSSQELEGGVGLCDQKVEASVENNIHLRESGLCKETLQVASGSVAEGLKVCSERGWNPADYTVDQLARMGTARQISIYDNVAKELGYGVTQILISEEELKIPRIKRKISGEIRRDMKGLIIPVANENETTGDDEAAKWEEIHHIDDQADNEIVVIDEEEQDDFENDRLARIIGELVEADLIIFFTGTDGVLEKNSNGEWGNVIEKIDLDDIDDLIGELGNEKSDNGSGGMKQKLNEAKEAALWARKKGTKRDIFIANYRFTALDVIRGNALSTRVVQ